MRRKVIKQGASTFTLSLPAQWARRLNIKAGDELELQEQGPCLLISSSRSSGPRRESIDLSGIAKLSRRLIAAKYVKGCEEFDVKVESRDQARAVQSRARSLQGIEVVNQTKDAILLKDVAGPQQVDVEQLLRRMFHMLSTMGQEAIEALKDQQSDLEYIEEMEEGLNRLWDLSGRAINRQGLDSYAKTTSIYTVCFLLEATADELKDALHFIRQHTVRLSKDAIGLLEAVFQFLKQLEEAVFSYSIKKADAMAKEYDLVSLSLQGRLAQKSPEEVVVLMHIRNMLEYLVWGMNQVLITS